MIQLQLPKIDPEKLNLKMLQAEPKGTIAIILDLEGKLRGFDQQGEEVAIVAAPAAEVTPKMQGEMVNTVSEKLNEGLNNALAAQREEMEEAFDEKLKTVTDELAELKKKK